MSPEWISFLASVLYGFPSVTLYCLTIFIIIRHQKSFNSSFFRLYISDGVMNISTFLNGFFTSRLMKITCKDCLFAPVFQNLGSFTAKFIIAMSFHMAYVQYSFTTLVSLNRLSVLINYNTMELFWKKSTLVLVLLIYFLPFFQTHIVFDYESKVVYLENSQRYSIESVNLPRADILSTVGSFTALTTFLSVAINTCSIILVHNLKTQIRSKAETNFLVIMAITCAVQLLGTVMTIALSVFDLSPFLMILKYATPYVSDGLSLVQPWLLICFSHAIRNQMKLLVGWNSKPQNSSNKLVHVRSVTSTI